MARTGLCNKLVQLSDGTYKHCEGRIVDKYRSYKNKKKQKIKICNVCGKIHENLTIEQMKIK